MAFSFEGLHLARIKIFWGKIFLKVIGWGDYFLFLEWWIKNYFHLTPKKVLILSRHLNTDYLKKGASGNHQDLISVPFVLLWGWLYQKIIINNNIHVSLHCWPNDSYCLLKCMTQMWRYFASQLPMTSRLTLFLRHNWRWRHVWRFFPDGHDDEEDRETSQTDGDSTFAWPTHSAYDEQR